MNSNLTYLLILAGSIAGPVFLSFDRKVNFFSKWFFVFAAGILPAVGFVVWDIYFTANHVWNFNPSRVIGAYLINLPVEEVLFFLVVPFCCLFIYECIRCYFPRFTFRKQGDIVLKLLAVSFLIIGLMNPERMYTSWSMLLCAATIAVIYIFPSVFNYFRSDYFLISYAVMLIPFLVVNGLLTAIPVVLYNNAENLDLRIYTIPVEDTVYGMLLILLNILGYEKMMHNRRGG